MAHVNDICDLEQPLTSPPCTRWCDAVMAGVRETTRRVLSMRVSVADVVDAALWPAYLVLPLACGV